MEKTFETPGGVRLFVENEVGLVAITTHATERTVVSLEPGTEGAAGLVERAVVECRRAGSGHVVAVKVPRLHGLRFIRRHAVTVRVEVPEGADVEVVAGSADIDITGPIGTADVTTASGDITIGAVGGDLRVHTASGDLRCTSVTGTAAFSTATGDLEVGAAGSRVELKATTGNVRLGELAHGARIVNVSGDVRVLALGQGTLHIRSVSGDVSVGVVDGVDLHVDVETMSGSVHSDIPLDDAPTARARGTQVDLCVRSVSGNVEIEQVA